MKWTMGVTASFEFSSLAASVRRDEVNGGLCDDVLRAITLYGDGLTIYKVGGVIAVSSSSTFMVSA